MEGTKIILSNFLAEPMVKFVIFVAIASIALLIAKRKTMGKKQKYPLMILGTTAMIIIVFIVLLAIVFGPDHPAVFRPL